MNPPLPPPPDGERRNLVLLFCDLCDSTALAAGMEPEAYADLLQRLRDAVAAIVPRHGGDVARIDGDGFLCLFGYPLAHEDEGRRAVEAALDLHAMAETIGASGNLRLHSGVHGGMVLLRPGDLVRGRWEMLGDATNVAARLCDQAPPGGILASEGTLARDRHFFRTGDRVAVPISGRARPVGAWPILGRAGIASRFAARAHGGRTPFAGRAGELDRLGRWLADRHDAPALLLHGPPGNGKTRLLEEWAGQARSAGWTVHTAGCEAYLAARPLQAMGRLCAALGGSADRPDALPRLALDSARRQPTLLAIDDWQWADDATVRLMDGMLAAAARDAGAGLKVVLVSRQGDSRLVGLSRLPDLALPALDQAGAAQAIHALVRVSDPATAARIADAAGGSPLLIEELCHAWRRGDLGLDGRLERSAWIDLLVQARLAALPPREAEVLRAAAVIGPAVPAPLLRALTGEAAGSPVLAALQAADFLYPAADGERMRFKHGLTRDAIYTGTGLAMRRLLHGRVAEILLAEPGADDRHAAALAHHLAASGDAARALPHAVRAGDAALAAGALDRAQAHYRAALAALDSLGDNAQAAQLYRRLLSKFGVVCLIDPSPEHLPVLEGLSRRLAAGNDAAAQTRGLYWLGALHYGMGRARHSVRLLRQSADLAERGGDAALMPMIAAKLAQSLMTAGDHGAADALCATLIPALRAGVNDHDREAFAYLLCCRAFHLADRGDFAASDALFAEAEALLAGTRPPMLASNACYRAAAELWRGDWARAEAHARDAIASCSESGVRYQAMMGHVLAAWARWRGQGDADAIGIMAETADWFARAGSRQRISLLHGWLAMAMAETGDAPRARHYAARALGRVREGADRLGEAMAWRAVALAEQARGNPAAADRALARARTAGVVRQSPRETVLAQLCEADLRRRRGDAAGAAELAARATAASAAMGFSAGR